MFATIPVLFVYVGFGLIAVLVVAMFIMLLKMGSAGRFWLKHNLLRGNSPVLIAQTHTNALKFYSVKDHGLSLRWGRDSFVFLPDLMRSRDENNLEFNEINKKTGHIDGKPVFLGAISASVACNPHLADTLALAQKGPTQIKTFFEGLKTTFSDRVKNIHLINTFSVKDLAEIMNIVITPQRLKTVYDYGETKGRNIVKTKETMLMLVIFALLLAVCFLSYMVTRP